MLHIIREFMRSCLITANARAIGSVQRDAIRNIKGKVGSVYRAGEAPPTGALYLETFGNTVAAYGVIGENQGDNVSVGFDASLSVPTAAENRPPNIAYAPRIHA